MNDEIQLQGIIGGAANNRSWIDVDRKRGRLEIDHVAVLGQTCMIRRRFFFLGSLGSGDKKIEYFEICLNTRIPGRIGAGRRMEEIVPCREFT